MPEPSPVTYPYKLWVNTAIGRAIGGYMERGIAGSEWPSLTATTISAEAYTSTKFALAERDGMWRKVWLQAGRLEDIPEPGDFMTFDILDDAVLIVRADADRINAFGNVCSHRGRRLVDTPRGHLHTRGHARSFTCGFHAWSYDLSAAASTCWRNRIGKARLPMK